MPAPTTPPPLIPEMPPAPSRSEGQAAFNLTAGPFIAAMGPMVVNINIALTWIGQQVTAVDGYRQAAAASAQTAAQQAAIATGAGDAAGAQVAQAKAYADNAAASATAAEGAPGSIGNLALIQAMALLF
jgi:hypothetical protein